MQTTNCDVDERHQDHLVPVVINGRQTRVSVGKVSYDELIDLAFDDRPTGPQICFSVTYRRGRGAQRGGSLAEGESVRVKPGMIFNVTATDKS